MIRVAIVTVSDSAVAGTREDRSGPALAARVVELGWTVTDTMTVPDEIDGIIAALEKMSGAEVVLTTGGDRCRAARRDVLPEATLEFSKREIPGMGEVDARRRSKIDEIRAAFPRRCGNAGAHAGGEFARIAARCGTVVGCDRGFDSACR